MSTSAICCLTAVDQAIGLFHVHDHKEKHFYRFATTFIPGAGVVAGEILESLWENLNMISLTVQMVTLAHRAEMLDDHCSDSNFKKLLGMGEFPFLLLMLLLVPLNWCHYIDAVE
jgi:hypothetical protein